MRIEQRLTESADRHGAHAAVVAGRASHSYAELALKSERLAAALQTGGVRRGDRVVLFLDDGWEALVSLFAVLKAGAVLVPVATRATANELAERLRCQPVAVVTQARLAAMVAGAIASVWSVRLIVLCGGDRARAGGTCISFEDTVGRIGRVAPLAAAGVDSDPAALFAGEALLSHRQLAEDAAEVAIDSDGIQLPRLADRAGLARLLAAVEGGRTMIACEDDGEHRIVAPWPAGSPFDMGQLFDGAAGAGGAPAFQR